MAVINGNFEVNGDISMHVLKVPPVDAIQVSWGGGELIRSARYVLSVELLCHLYSRRAQGIAQSGSGCADLAGSRQAAPFSSMHFILQILILLPGLVRYQTYWLENLSYCKILNDQDSFNSKAELALRERTPPYFKTLDPKKKRKSLYFNVFIHWSKIAKHILIVYFF